MNKKDKNFKSEVATKTTPSNEVLTDVGAGAVSNILQDEPTTGAFQEEAKAEQAEANEPKAEQPITQGEAIAEIPAPVKAVMGIDERLKTVENLHRLLVQRENLLERIETLNDFEIDLIDASDELESNHFTGCKLIIMANNGKQFVTNTSNLIVKVVDFVKEACANKKAELENNIIFPN